MKNIITKISLLIAVIFVSLSASAQQGNYPFCFTDSYGYQWSMHVTNLQISHKNLSGTVDLGGGVVWQAEGRKTNAVGLTKLKGINPDPDGCTTAADYFVYAVFGGNHHGYEGSWKNSCGDEGSWTGSAHLGQCGTNSSGGTTTGPANLGGFKLSSTNVAQLTLSNAPNPFFGTSAINYTLPVSGKVSINIFNTTGQLVKVIANEVRDAGTYSVEWNGSDNNGQVLSAGLYLCTLQTAQGTISTKMIIER